MTYLTRMVAFLITVFLGLFSVVGTPTWKREAPLRVAAYIVVSDVEAAKALDDSHLDDLTDIILISNTGWFGTDGKLHMAEAFGDVAAWFRARTAKNHTRLLVTMNHHNKGLLQVQANLQQPHCISFYAAASKISLWGDSL